MNRIYTLKPEVTPVHLADAITARFNQLHALIILCQSDDFLDFKEEHIKNYLWLQSEFIDELKELFAVFCKSRVNS